MVATPKSFLNSFLFLIRLLVAIPVATAGDSTGEARESSYLIRYADWMWFSFFFSFFFIYLFSFISFFPLSFISLLLLLLLLLLFCLFFYLYILVSILIYLYLSLGMIVCNLFRIFCYISAWEVFWLFCRWGLWYASSSLHTHTLCAYHERGPIPRSV